MSYLVDLEQSLIPSITSSLQFVLLAITYHSSYSHLLYALYGQSPSNATNPYQNYFLLTHDSLSGSVISNISLNAFCSRECRIKATSSLFLLETDNRVLLYSMQADLKTVSTSSVFLNQTKNYNASDSFQYQCADIFGDQFMYSDGNHLYFIKRTGNVPTSLYFALPSPTIVLSAAITDSFAVLTTKSGSMQIMLINCIACVFNYSYTSGTTMTTSMYKIIPRAGSATKWLRVARAASKYQSGNVTVLWILQDGAAEKLAINLNTLSTTQLSTLSLGPNALMVTNYDLILFTNNTNQAYLTNYSLATSSLQILMPQNSSNILQATISSQSLRIALHYDSDNFTVKLYMFASNCDSYQAQLQGNQCVCLQFQDGVCKSKNSSLGGGSSEPQAMSTYGIALIGVLGALAGAVAVFSIYLCWGCWKKAAKMSRRRGWKYNPRQFMSLQM